MENIGSDVRLNLVCVPILLIETAFADLDVDTDGYINQEEATADESLNQVFAAIAKDGKVDEKSFADWKALSGLEQN